MSEKPTNPIAFPFAAIDQSHQMEPWIEQGMTLRDYFAAQFVCGTISTVHPISVEPAAYEKFARMGYAMADAMLRARQSMESEG